jgi:hypothetical protein
MATFLGHGDTADRHFHGQGRHGRAQSGAREGTLATAGGFASTDVCLFIIPHTLSVLILRMAKLRPRLIKAMYIIVAEGGPGQDLPMGN